MGQWYLSNFILTKDICDSFPNEIKSLPLLKKQYHVMKWLIKQQNFYSAENFMMMGKASLFKCSKSFNLMGLTDNPGSHKKLGRHVTGFNDVTWNEYCCNIVKIGNYLKFSQDENIRHKLKETGSAILIEGSPLDKNWGVGLRFDNPNIE
ncbi:uncharacterized protein LOC101236998 [Hydra vulgaris]|uniref:uncharacterized protein LOC101236998 n=1 Tax=Hydra vulgaris TaxID=6087 RepID=UPI0002B44FA8|nr:uncharacterized protein LOC101236998 [Hydra vulgaris]